MTYPTKKLGDILDIIRNGKSCKQNKEGIGDKITRIETISDSFIDDNRVGFFELSNEDKKKFLIHKGDILFSHINSVEHIGKVALSKVDYQDLYHGMNLLLLRGNKIDILDNFLYIVLRYYFTKGYWRDVCKKAINQASLNQKNILSIQIPLPPLPTQKAIVEKLDTAFAEIDASIELAEKSLQEIEEMNASVLEEVFGGEEYEEKKLIEVSSKITDGSHNPPKGIPEGYPMISSRNLEMNNIVFDNIRYISEGDYIRENKRTNVEDGDILLSIVGTIGKVCVVKKEFGKFTMQRSLAVIKIDKNILDPMYVYYFFNSRSFQKLIYDGANGAAQKGIYLNQLKELKIPLPSLEKQKEIVEYLDKVFEKNKELKELYEEKLKDLREMKQSLLREAFEGRLLKD